MHALRVESLSALQIKLQNAAASSSAEAEFIAAISAAKHFKHLRVVLEEAEFEQKDPTKIKEDSAAAIFMASDGAAWACNTSYCKNGSRKSAQSCIAHREH